LQGLINRVRADPNPQSWQRRKAINQLLPILNQLPGRVKYSHINYLEALDLTWEWVCQAIDRFEPRPHESTHKSLITWINQHLKQQLLDLDQFAEPNSDAPFLSHLDDDIQ